MRRPLPLPASCAAISLALILLLAGRAAAMCTRDTDCKAGRICDMGRCIESRGVTVEPRPAASPRPAPVQAPAGRPGWYRGYFEQGLVLTLHGWGGSSSDLSTRTFDLDADIMVGTRMAGYAVLSDRIHLGGYFAYYAGNLWTSYGLQRSPSRSHGAINFGFAMKIGGRVGRRVWLGCALDVGASFWAPDAGSTLYGFQINPAFDVDVLALSAGKFRLGVFTTFGPQIIPFAGKSDLGVDSSFYLVNLALVLGITLGVG